MDLLVELLGQGDAILGSIDEYVVLMSSRDELNKIEKIDLLTNFVEEVITQCQEEKFFNLLQDAEIELIQLFKDAGRFNECIKIGEHLKLLTADSAIREDVLINLIEVAFACGNLEQESKYISEFFIVNEIVDVEKVWHYLSRFFSKINAIDSWEYIEKHLKIAMNNDNEELRFRISEQAVLTCFYLGDIPNGLKISKDIEIQFKDFLNEHSVFKLEYEHTMGILMHNVDRNNDVINISKKLKKDYLNLNDHYNYLISCVNLADGYMAKGKLEKAEIEMKKVYLKTNELPWKHAQNIATICYANVLSCRGRLSEALYYYERGIALTKEIQHFWDLYYAQIWRQLTLAEMGENTVIEKLYILRAESTNKGYLYLSNLASCFILVSHWLLKMNIDIREGNTLIDSIDENMSPGIKAQAIGAFLAVSTLAFEDEKQLFNSMIKNTLKCQGTKGRPQVIKEIFDKMTHISVSKKNHSKMKNWISKYVDVIMKDITELEKKIFKDFEARPLLKQGNCKNCEATCCYDGVYIETDEEKKLVDIVTEFPRYFTHLPEQYIVDGGWKGVLNGRKTAVRNHKYNNINFPQHFEKTRCVFAMENGLCSLQKLALDLDFHPWKFKPLTCWFFPLSYTLDEDIIPPPLSGEKDPYYFGESYPGYITYLPCSKEESSEKPWYLVYKQELLYYKFNCGHALYKENK